MICEYDVAGNRDNANVEHIEFGAGTGSGGLRKAAGPNKAAEGAYTVGGGPLVK